jgi:putative transposase
MLSLRYRIARGLVVFCVLPNGRHGDLPPILWASRNGSVPCMTTDVRGTHVCAPRVFDHTLVAKKFDGSRQRKALGRPKIDQELEALAVRMAQENRRRGYDRFAGALKHLGYMISDQTVGNILKRHGMPFTPERKNTTTWKEFIRTHMDVLVATDFFTTEVWTCSGLVTSYVLFFIRIGTREVQVAGLTPHPDTRWMRQIARNLTMADWGFLIPGQYLIHDRDGTFSLAFEQAINAAGVQCVSLPRGLPI